MSLNDDFTETFIFSIKQDIYKVVINYSKKMCTVYAHNGRILLRMEKLSRVKMNRIKKQIEEYMRNSSGNWGNIRYTFGEFVW